MWRQTNKKQQQRERHQQRQPQMQPHASDATTALSCKHSHARTARSRLIHTPAPGRRGSWGKSVVSATTITVARAPHHVHLVPRGVTNPVQGFAAGRQPTDFSVTQRASSTNLQHSQQLPKLLSSGGALQLRQRCVVVVVAVVVVFVFVAVVAAAAPPPPPPSRHRQLRHRRRKPSSWPPLPPSFRCDRPGITLPPPPPLILLKTRVPLYCQGG
jgi:hypothetical protein